MNKALMFLAVLSVCAGGTVSGQERKAASCREDREVVIRGLTDSILGAEQGTFAPISDQERSRDFSLPVQAQAAMSSADAAQSPGLRTLTIDERMAVAIQASGPPYNLTALRPFHERLNEELKEFDVSAEGAVAQENIRRYCSVNFKAEEEARQEFARKVGDLAGAVTIATLILSPKNTPVAAHHLYWGWIMEKIGQLEGSRLVERIGNQIKWDDVFNHTLPLALGIGEDESSPVHVLHSKLWQELHKRFGVEYPLKK